MLTVKEPFSLGAKSYSKGAHITDPNEVKAVLEHHAGNVVRTHHHAPPASPPESPAPAPASQPDAEQKPETDTSRARAGAKSTS